MAPLRRSGWALLLFLLVGCARFPDVPVERGVRRLVIEMQVAGRIRPEYHYFVLFNLSNDPTGQAGPVPVLIPPWGNGFAGGEFTHFMRFDRFQPQSRYALYRVVPQTNLSVFEYIGVPIQVEPVGAESNRLRFEITLTQFIPDPEDAKAMRHIQLNFIATDRVPLDPNDTAPKVSDALGPPGLGQYLNLQIAQDGVIRNAEAGLETAGDVADPDLDIVDWRVEVRTL